MRRQAQRCRELRLCDVLDEHILLSIKNPEVEALVDDIARRTGESKTEAIRKALLERRDRLAFQIVPQDGATRLLDLCKREIWPTVPKTARGRRLARREEERLLGYGPSGL